MAVRYEAGNGNAAGGQHNDEVIGPFAAVVRRDTAHGNAQAERHRHGNAGGAAGDGQFFGNDLVDGTAALFQAQAHIAVQQAVHIVHILHAQGLVQAVLFVQCLLGGRTDGFLGHERSAGDQVHDEEGKRRHNKDTENAHCHALDDVLRHCVVPLRFVLEYNFASAGRFPAVVRGMANTVVRYPRTMQRTKKAVAVAVAQTPSFIPGIFSIIMNLSSFVNWMALLNFDNPALFRLKKCENLQFSWIFPHRAGERVAGRRRPLQKGGCVI